MKSFLIVLIITFLLFSQRSYARKGLMGKNDKLTKIMDVDIIGPKGEELYLAHKTTSLFLFFGVYIKDDGYVLAIKKSWNSYYPLDDKMIKNYQEKGFLPKELPKNKISFFDYLVGYSLWIVLILIIGFQILKYRFAQEEKNKTHNI